MLVFVFFLTSFYHTCLLFAVCSRTLRTLQLWFVSLPGKGPGECLMDRMMGSGKDVAELAVQVSTSVCSAWHWNSCTT